MVNHASPTLQGSYVEHVSAHGFAATVAHLEQTIAQAGLTIFARIDHAGAARGVGLAMPQTLVLIYGNPRGGTPVMLTAPQAALDLPLRVLVREDRDGRVLVGFHPIAAVLRSAAVADDLVARLAHTQALLMEGVRS